MIKCFKGFCGYWRLVLINDGWLFYGLSGGVVSILDLWIDLLLG